MAFCRTVLSTISFCLFSFCYFYFLGGGWSFCTSGFFFFFWIRICFFVTFLFIALPKEGNPGTQPSLVPMELSKKSSVDLESYDWLSSSARMSLYAHQRSGFVFSSFFSFLGGGASPSACNRCLFLSSRCLFLSFFLSSSNELKNSGPLTQCISHNESQKAEVSNLNGKACYASLRSFFFDFFVHKRKKNSP